jgi:hypothetical protein
MNGLERRVEKLEEALCIGLPVPLWAEVATDGGLFIDGQFYADAEAAARDAGGGIDNVIIFHWEASLTAEELRRQGSCIPRTAERQRIHQ